MKIRIPNILICCYHFQPSLLRLWEFVVHCITITVYID